MLAWASIQSDGVFAVHSMCCEKPSVASSGQPKLRSDWTDAQADLSLCTKVTVLVALLWLINM